MKLNIGYFYSKLLNLYGDNGNVEILVSRARARNIDVEVVEINPISQLDSVVMENINLVFMGGGPDSSQKIMYEDLLKNKGPYLLDYIEGGGVGLYICGSYQLLGNYYRAADGTVIEGLHAFDLYTEHFGNKKPRCIGNTYCEISKQLVDDPTFKSVNTLKNYIVGFENHGGRTYLGSDMQPFAKVVQGYGNNAEDGTEGVLYKNSIGTYFHGPLLSRNSHIADYLIAKALKIDTLSPLDDSMILEAYTASKNYKQ